MKARRYGFWVLAAALAASTVPLARTAYPMALTAQAQQPAEPDVAFVDPGNQTASVNQQGSSPGTSVQMKSGAATNSALQAAPSGANRGVPALAPGVSVNFLVKLVQIVPAFGVFLYH